MERESTGNEQIWCESFFFLGNIFSKRDFREHINLFRINKKENRISYVRIYEVLLDELILLAIDSVCVCIY